MSNCKKESILVGYGEADYAPICIGVGLGGYGNEATRICTGIHGPGLDIEVLAVTDCDGTSAVLCSVEAVTIATIFQDVLREWVAKTYAIPLENVMISPNHQHSTPIVGIGAISDFNEKFFELFKQAVAKAFADRSPATIQSAMTQVEGLNFNRNAKAYSFDGQFLGMVTPNHVEKDVKGTYGLVQEYDADPSVQLVRFRRADAKDIIIANFAVHPHAWFDGPSAENRLASANFVGIFRDKISQKYDCHTMYFTGAGAELNMGHSPKYHTDATLQTKTPAPLPSLEACADAMAAVVPAKDSIDWIERKAGKVKAAAAAVTIHKNDEKDDLYEIAKAIHTAGGYTQRIEALAKAMEGVEDPAKTIYSIYHAESIVKRHTQPQTREMDVFAISIGDIAFAGGPYEMFSSDGRIIREGNGHPVTVITYLTNGHNGYIPSEEHWQSGGYSCDIAYCARGTAAALDYKMIELLNDMR